MADVQLEKGHVRIANPVMEALALAPLNGGQVRVLVAIIRATWGWQRKEAELSTGDLADSTGLARSTAAAALRVLVDEGVVLEVSPPSFSSSGVYRPQKDPTRWGKFAVQPPALSEDSETPETRTVQDSAPETPEFRTGDSGIPDTKPPRGVAAQAIPEAERQSKDIGKDNAVSSIGPEIDEAELVREIIRAANRAMQQNDRINQARLKPIRSNDGHAQQAVLDWLEVGTPPPVILRTVQEVASAYRPKHATDQINSMKYFTPAIGEAWERELAKEHDLSRADQKMLKRLRDLEETDLSTERSVLL